MSGIADLRYQTGADGPWEPEGGGSTVRMRPASLFAALMRWHAARCPGHACARQAVLQNATDWQAEHARSLPPGAGCLGGRNAAAVAELRRWHARRATATIQQRNQLGVVSVFGQRSVKR